MQFKADTTGMMFVATGEVKPITDFESGQQRTDRDGAPLWGVRLLVVTETDRGQVSNLITVKVAGQPGPLVAGGQVRVIGLVLTPWSRGERGGVGYRADRIEPVTPGTSGATRDGAGTGGGAGRGGPARPPAA